MSDKPTSFVPFDITPTDRCDPNKVYAVGLNVVEYDTETGETRVLPPLEDAAFRRWVLRKDQP